MKCKPTRPYRTQTNDKGERFNCEANRKIGPAPRPTYAAMSVTPPDEQLAVGDDTP